MASAEERHDRATNITSRNGGRNQRGEELGQVTTGKRHDEVVCSAVGEGGERRDYVAVPYKGEGGVFAFY